MGKIGLQALVAILCCVQTLPPGWCCLLPVRSCCAADATPSAPAEAPSACCCCADPGPQEAPREAPARVCCCERFPARLPDAPLLPAAPVAVAAEAPAEPVSVVPGRVAPPAEVRAEGPTPRHVLLCVWTC